MTHSRTTRWGLTIRESNRLVREQQPAETASDPRRLSADLAEIEKLQPGPDVNFAAQTCWDRIPQFG